MSCKRFLIVLSVIIFLLDIHNAMADWYNTNWQYRKKITVSSAMTPNTDRANFPLMVRRTSDSNLAGHCQGDGDDILFTASNGLTKLDHEIEKYGSSTGELWAWVRIPSLSSSANTDIYMYYGHASITGQQNATGVWDSNFKGVWHLSEASSATRMDSTANNNDLTDQNGVTGTSTGRINGAADFENSTADQLLKITHASQTGLSITGTITVSAWFNAESAATMVLASKWGTSGVDQGYILRFSTNRVTLVLSGNGTSSTSFNSPTDTAGTGTFHHAVGVYDGATAKIYIDTSVTSTTYTNGIFASTMDFNIGARNSNNQEFDGIIDEVRVSNTDRSADWITTEYNNQSSPDTYITLGSEERAPADAVFFGPNF